MNLLIINLDKAIFSESSASLERLKEYCRLVDKIFVIVWTMGQEQPIIFQDKLFIYPTNSFGRLFYFFDTFKIARHIFKNNKINLLFTQDPFETGLAGWLIAKIYKIKLQLQVHTDIFSPYFRRQSLANKIRAALAKILVKQADSLRVVSRRIKDSLSKIGVPEEKIFTLPIYVDTKKFEQAEVKINLHKKYPQFDFIILMASRISREKNINLAIEAMPDIIKLRPRAGLIIVGLGQEKGNIINKIKNLKLGENIKVESWTNDLASYYKSADLFLLTSNYEGWGLAVVEAMASCCPVVMTDVGCAGELVRHGQSGLVVPVGEKAALSRAIREMIKNKELRKKIKINALAAVEVLSSKEEYLNSYKKSWESIK